MGYKDIAEPLAARRVPTIPLRPRSKIAFLNDWQDKATISLAQIEEWDLQYPDANCASVALANPTGIWFFEIDQPQVIQKIEIETGQKMPRTFRVRSSPGRGHFYFKQSSASIAMGNRQGSENGKESWSARIEKRYVVSPGSIHPTTGIAYEVLSTAPIIECPQWLIDWCIKNSEDKSSRTVSLTDTDPIISGNRNNALTSIAGVYRNKGLNAEEIYALISKINDDRCSPPLDDSEVETIAYSVARYKVPDPEPRILIGGRPISAQSHADDSARTETGTVAAVSVSEPILERPYIPPIIYPKFPEFVMWGTSLYEGLVKPICDKNSRYPEFMFVPAVTMLLNYIGCRVRLKHNPELVPSLFSVLIGLRGKTHKSASVGDAIKYFEFCGLSTQSSTAMKNSEGKTIVFTAGSAEGLGMEMQRLNCKNAVLFYDELSVLTNKASIDSSTLISNLLQMYESAKFSNTIKSKKEQYNFDPGSYCASLIACCTDKNFLTNWSKLAGASTGLDDRFFFLYQPEKLKKSEPFEYVATQPGSVLTRQRIDQAISQGIYEVDDRIPLAALSEENDRREIRAEKFALAFAVDLGKTSIDEDCVERAAALIKYEKEVKDYLRTYEAVTREASLQLEIRTYLHRCTDGESSHRDLIRKLHAERYGTTLWNQAYYGLIKSGAIAELGSNVKGDPTRIILLEAIENEEAD